MDVEFVKVNGRACLARATRSDGAVIETTATAKGGLPHDLEHLLVEAALAYEDGFWGLVARGAEFSSMTVTTARPRRRPRSENRAMTRGYSGWGEALVGSVVDGYREVSATGWHPPQGCRTCPPSRGCSSPGVVRRFP